MLSQSSPTYGGQALLEGVMIRGKHCASIAVRRPDSTVALRVYPINPIFAGLFHRIPFVRGVFTLIETITLGMRALTYSANVGMEEEGEEIGRMGMIGMVTFSLLFAIGLFFLLPVIASKPLEGILGSDIASYLAEGIIRLVIFLVYIYLIGRLKQIDRVFMYHGAEHMTVHAQEHLDPLKVENIRKYPTAHPRCGTAFLLIVMVLAVVAFTFVGRDPFWWLLASRIVLIPVIAAVSYEIIRFSGFHTNNIIVKLIIAPSLALQMLTTRQPNDDQIEIAIAAMNQALDVDGNTATQNNV